VFCLKISYDSVFIGSPWERKKEAGENEENEESKKEVQYTRKRKCDLFDDGGSMHFLNVGKLLPYYTAQQARRHKKVAYKNQGILFISD
jgi:hypothetical protein